MHTVFYLLTLSLSICLLQPEARRERFLMSPWDRCWREAMPSWDRFWRKAMVSPVSGSLVTCHWGQGLGTHFRDTVTVTVTVTQYHDVIKSRIWTGVVFLGVLK